jgi:hypothetical protein
MKDRTSDSRPPFILLKPDLATIVPIFTSTVEMEMEMILQILIALTEIHSISFQNFFRYLKFVLRRNSASIALNFFV